MTARRQPIEYADASSEVRAVYDDIIEMRKTDWVMRFCDPVTTRPISLER